MELNPENWSQSQLQRWGCHRMTTLKRTDMFCMKSRPIEEERSLTIKQV
jgi:hypothetical protein